MKKEKVKDKGKEKVAKASARYVRVSPRKARKIIDLIRGRDVHYALSILAFTSNKSARIVEKVVRSAQANAENNFQLNKEDLYIKNAYVDKGPTIKRFLPRALGRATPLHKRTSHITVVVKEREK